MICHFPGIFDEKLVGYVWGDETLLGIILIQFQMKIMEQLLLFCANHYASQLVIYVEDDQDEVLGIYREFLYTEYLLLNQTNDNTQLTIPTHQYTFQNWSKFMNKVTLKFGQTLWQKQRTNPAVRHYLKTHPFG